MPKSPASRKPAKFFFNQSGLPLNKNFKETIESLIDANLPFHLDTTPKEKTVEPLFSLIDVKPIKEKTPNKIKTYFQNLYQTIEPTLKQNSYAYITVGSLLLIVTAIGLVIQPSKINADYSNEYSIFSSTPLTIGSTTTKFYGDDARAETLDKVLRDYDCPMAGLGATFVDEADKNDIPYWLVAAVSFQESNCGKKTPQPEGIESYNAWGWGVWADNVHKFSSWEDGISTVSKYMNKKFYSKGITEPCDIMRVYTPPSNGSWCSGVNYFKEVIVDFAKKEVTPTAEATLN